MNVLMQEWIATLTTRIEALAGENGELRADLRNERERREAIEQENDAAKKELTALRLARVTEGNHPVALSRLS